MKNTVRLIDVAKRAGVSVGTASRVINHHPAVRDDKRRRVLEAIEEMGYQINDVARSLKANSTKTIGVLIPDIANEFYADVVRGMEDVARGRGYSYILSSTDSNTEKELRSMMVMREKQVDGIVMMSHTVAPSLLQYIEENRLSVVLVASGVETSAMATVSIDNKQAARDAVNYLISLGHKRIAMIGGPVSDLSGGVARLEGYRQVMREHGLPIPQEYEQIGMEYTYQTGYDKMELLLQMEEPPSAVFVAGDYMAIGAIKAIHGHGISIPAEIAVMGFDNLAVSQYCSPSLTTVNQPRYQMGQEAMQLLFQCIEEDGAEKRNIVLPHEIIRRQSTEADIARG